VYQIGNLGTYCEYANLTEVNVLTLINDYRTEERRDRLKTAELALTNQALIETSQALVESNRKGVEASKTSKKWEVRHAALSMRTESRKPRGYLPICYNCEKVGHAGADCSAPCKNCHKGGHRL
jgi:hypothetical protein